MSANNPSLSVNPKKLIASSDDVSQPQQTIKGAVDKLVTTINSLPPRPWGDDEIGHQFGLVYEGHGERADADDAPKYDADWVDQSTTKGYQKLIEITQELATGLKGLSDKTLQMGENYLKNEQANLGG